MNRVAIVLAVIILPAWAPPAPASGILGFFGKKTKVNPSERVPELIVAIKTDQDERKRASAAAELGAFDASAHPEIVPVLVDALQNDPKYAVRMDAASSLGSLRPVSPMAGQALEKAVSSDSNLRVRLHAKAILIRYRVSGYSPGSKAEQPGANPGSHIPHTNEPPLLEPDVMPKPQVSSGRPPALFPTGPLTFANTSLSKVPGTASKEDVLEFRPSVARPLPLGPAFTTSVPQQTSKQAPPALPMVETEGPSLGPIPPPPSSLPVAPRVVVTP